MPEQVFAKFTGPEITGSVTAKGHEGDIALLSWHCSCKQPTLSVQDTTGEDMVQVADQQPLSFTKRIDSATTELIKFSTSGRHIDSFKLMCYLNTEGLGSNTEAKPTLSIHLESVTIASHSVVCNEGDAPVEKVSLNYDKVTYTYDTPPRKNTPEEPQIVVHDLRTNVIQ